MRTTQIFFSYNFLFFLLISISFQVKADTRADTFAKARIELLQNRIASVKGRIKCKQVYPENFKQQTACTENVARTYANKKLPTSLGNELAKLVRPDMEKIAAQCLDELGNDAHPAQVSNCRAKSIGKFFQTVALIRQGTIPESYFDPQYSESANAELRRRLTAMEKELEILQERLVQKILVSFNDMECKAKGQQEAWLDRPDCQHRYKLEAPEGYQYCKSISETDKGSRPNKDNAVKLTWGYLYFDDVTFNDGTKKVKGRYVDTHATGGPWHDKYSAVSRAQAVILFTNVRSSKAGLESIGCYVPPEPNPTAPEDPPVGPSPHMNISMSIKKNPNVSHTGTLTIRADGVPPYSINYRVEAFRKGKWHEALKGTIKFTKPNSTTIRDIYWYEAESWRVKRL